MKNNIFFSRFISIRFKNKYVLISLTLVENQLLFHKAQIKFDYLFLVVSLVYFNINIINNNNQINLS